MISGKTKIFGIFSYPIEHTLSPLMHNKAFKYLGMDSIYIPFKVKPSNLKDAISGIKGLNINGVNITLPYKEEVIKFLDVIKDEAMLIGAVNTILNDNGKLIGTNTDGVGFLYSLERDLNISPEDKNIFILGAGGAARAIIVSLAMNKTKRIVVANREFDKGKGLISEYMEIFKDVEFIATSLDKDIISKYLKDSHIFINATPIGMKNTKSDVHIPLENLPKDSIIFDTVYNPEETEFILRAKALGLRYKNGLGMFCYQGALSFEFWTGKDAPINIMMEALKLQRPEI